VVCVSLNAEEAQREYVVLVHGPHTGDELETVAEPIRAAGHVVHAPTAKGNRPDDVKNIGLAEAIESIIEFFDEHELQDIVLVGHSYGGMIITAVADRLPHRVRRLVSRGPQPHGERGRLKSRWIAQLIEI
jgi:pimeloyl-ACP methyl ester carboxylesterase